MENKEPKHLKVCRILGFTFIVLAVALIVMGAIAISASKVGIAMLIPGMFFLFFSAPCLFVGFSAKIQKAQIATQKYIQGETKEDLTEMAGTTADIVSPAVKKISKAVKDGVKNETMFCKHCGVEIDTDSTFCKSCGKKQ